MNKLEIVKYPDPILREVCLEVKNFDQDLRDLLDQMAECMYKAPGIGLAAPQVGKNIRAIVVDVGADEETSTPAKLYKLLNPQITSSEGKVESDEGCLSLPGISGKVLRSASLVIKAQDEFGKELALSCDGLLAICIQHEIDHLNGVLFIDHLSRLKRELLKKKLKRLESDFLITK